MWSLTFGARGAVAKGSGAAAGISLALRERQNRAIRTVSGEHLRWTPWFQTEAWRRTGLVVVAVSYAIFFFRMVRTGFRSWFSQDDLLNLYYCWSRPALDLLRANVLFVNNYNRPAAELLYRVLYSLFGFNPAASNAVRFAFCVANLAVLYIFVWRISRSREAGVIAVLLGGFHVATESLFLDTGMIFDVLAFFFYYSALTLYVKCREAGRFPGTRLTAGILGLSIFALNSKEIAVTFPVALLLYELTIGSGYAKQPQWRFPAVWQRFRLIVLSGFVTLVFIVGKNSGAEALSRLAGYHPTLSFSVYLDTYSRYAAAFTFLSPESIRPWLVWILAGCIGLALLARDRVLLWASLFNVFGVFPVAFIPARAGFAFEVPLAGWLVYLAIVICRLRERLIFGRDSLRAPSQLAVAAAIALLILNPQAGFMRKVMRPLVHEDQDLVRNTLESLRTILPGELAGKKVLSLRDPLRNPFGLGFLIQLSYNERGVTVDTARLLSQQSQAIVPADYDYVVDYVDSKFVMVRAPGSK